MAIRAKVFAVSLGSFCLAVSLLAAAAPAIAQGLSALQSGDQPLAINADEGIEWRRDSNQYLCPHCHLLGPLVRIEARGQRIFFTGKSQMIVYPNADKGS